MRDDVHRSRSGPAVRHERADVIHSTAQARDQSARNRASELSIGPRPGDGGSLASSRTLSNYALKPALHCRPGSPRARRLGKEHIARLCPLTDIDGSTGSTRCALGRGTSTGTTWHGRHIIINRGR